MKIQINYEVYDRMGGTYNTIIIEGATLRSCLLEAYDRLSLYEEAEDVIYDEVNNIGHRLSDNELLNRMTDQSGDGSDYIFSIINLEDNSYIYHSGESQDSNQYESNYDDEPSYEDEVEEYKEDDED